MGKQIEKVLPQNIEAEMGVLGSIIIDPEAIDQVIGYLRPDDFYRDAHRLIYETVMNLKQQGNEADYITVCDVLERRDKLELVGGASYITSLINQVPTSGNIGYYGRIVQRTGVLRRLVAATGQIAALVYEDVEVEMILEQAERTIFEISQNFLLSTSTDIGMAPLMSQYMAILERRYEMRGEVVGVPTGYEDLDRLLGGLQRSDLDILAARTSIGKTALAINIAYNAAIDHKRNVGIFSLEMSSEQLAQRFVALESGIEQQKLRTGRFDDYTWEPLINAVGKLAALGERGIRIDDTAGISLLQVRSRARRWVAEYGIELIIIDYLQLVTTGDNRKYENRQQEVSAISRGLKALARELNVPVLALAQLSRQLESRQSKVPQLSDLRESGCLTGDTPIYLPDEGIYRQIKDLVGQSGFRVLALNTETWKLEPHTVTNAFSTGRKQTYKIITRLGRTIRATANHKFLTIHGWKRLDELQSGTHLALPRNLPSPSNQSMTNAELALLGHLIGDGCTLERSAIQYITGDCGLAESVMHLATEVFGDRVRPHMKEVKRITDRNIRYYVFLTSAERLTHKKRNPVAVWLDGLEIFNCRSYEKFVPNKVFAQTKSDIARFLRHLWSTDGCVNLSKGKGYYANVYYASCSLRLAQDVQSLLLRLGINATLSRHSQGSKGRDQYHVSVSGKSEILSFLSLIGGLGQYKEVHQVSMERYFQDRVANTNRDIIPSVVWRMLVVPAMQTIGMTTRQMQAALGNAYCGTGLYKQNMSRERAARLAKIVLSEPLMALAQSDVYWDSILSISIDEETEVYDLTVEGLHNFVASDIIVHNSIENDADVVMFIYRDEVYNPETERKGQADIIVAKHRNGPTGEVVLAFDQARSRFRDLDIAITPDGEIAFAKEDSEPEDDITR